MTHTLSNISALVRGSFILLGIGACTGCGSDPSSARVVVPSGTVTQVVVAPTSTSVAVGATTPLTATAYDASGAVVSSASITWSTSANATATVSSNGVVSGVAAGTATITASSGGHDATSMVTVVTNSTSNGTVTVDGTQRFQTMTGWEALMEIGQAECDPRAYATYKNELLDRAADEVGINRIRIGLRNGYENPVDLWTTFHAGGLTFNQWKKAWFQVVNDNADPFSMNAAGFNWGYLDWTIEQLIIPLRQRLAARGENLWVNFSYTGASSGQLHRDNPDEYSEFVLAAFQHVKQKYGFVPNSLELVNEPDVGGWTAPPVGHLLLNVKQRLSANGFFPEFVGPTGSEPARAISFFDQIAAIPGVTSALNEFSYHRYGTPATVAELQAIAARGKQYGLRTAMLEHGGSDYNDLHDDLTIANVSAWQQFGLGFCTDKDIGGAYFIIPGAELGNNSPVIKTGERTKYLRQYFRYVQLGAVRVGAASADTRFSPVAFRNTNGKYTVVVKATSGGSFTIGGLPAGTYGIEFTVPNDYKHALADVTISGSQTVSTAIPAAGVLTVFAR